MEIYGGRAGYNSVSFIGATYQSLAQFQGKEIKTKTKRKRENNKILAFSSKVPFIRAFSFLIELMINHLKLFIFYIITIVFIGVTNTNMLDTIPVNALVMMLCFFIIAGLFIKITPVGKYHAAEHMAANAYDRYQSLTLERVKKQPRTHKNCGTNLVISIFVCFCILFMAFGDAFWVLLVSWGVGYEIWRAEPRIIWGAILLIGKAAQHILFTSKPEEKHLHVAIEAIRKLEEKESAGEN